MRGVDDLRGGLGRVTAFCPAEPVPPRARGHLLEGDHYAGDVGLLNVGDRRHDAPLEPFGFAGRQGIRCPCDSSWYCRTAGCSAGNVVVGAGVDAAGFSAGRQSNGCPSDSSAAAMVMVLFAWGDTSPCHERLRRCRMRRGNRAWAAVMTASQFWALYVQSPPVHPGAGDGAGHHGNSGKAALHHSFLSGRAVPQECA
jgi:hypothetical protein